MNGELCKDSPYSIEIALRVDKCYDMESMATFLRETDTSKYDYFLYVNCGMVGPKMKDDGEHWTETFMSKLSDKVKLTGVSINMSFYPHVQSMSLATDRVGIDIIKKSNAVFDCGVMNHIEMTKEERWRIIDRYELGMSKAIHNAGYSIASLTGALGKAITIAKDDIAVIKNKVNNQMLQATEVSETERNVWDSNTQSAIFPLGDDIWNANAIRSIGGGKLPSWSDFVFYKVSRGIVLPEILDEVKYSDATIEVIEDLGDTSLPVLVDPNRDICEEAKTNFREASKLSVIITGHEHSGTTMLSQLVKSDPSLYGGFEGGVSILHYEPQFYQWLTWGVENDLWALNSQSRDIVVNARCSAERYHNLQRYSPLFHYGNHQNSGIVDKAPKYLQYITQIMDETPGIPVLIAEKTDEMQLESFRKRGLSEDFIRHKMEFSKKEIEKAMKKYPGRIKLVNTTAWTEQPNEIMGDVFDFLGLSWKPEYLNMEAMNSKRIPGSVISKPFVTSSTVATE